MRTLLFLILLSAVACAQQPPTSACDFDGFDTNSKLSEVKSPTTAYYGCGTGKCLPMRLSAGDPVVVTREEAGWTCGYLVAAKGSAQGWVRFSDLRPLDADPNPPLSAWLGKWLQKDNSISIFTTKSPGRLDLEGESYWHGIGDNVRSGSLSGESTPTGSKLHYEEEDCMVDLALIGKYLIANDNNMCGGVNVRFWGVWKRSNAR